jgi:hypothetical protein
MCSQSGFTENRFFFCHVQKRKNGSKISSSRYIHLSFLHSTQKILVYRETWHAHVECREVCTDFGWNFFDILKCLFWWQEHMHPISELQK